MLGPLVLALFGIGGYLYYRIKLPIDPHTARLPARLFEQAFTVGPDGIVQFTVSAGQALGTLLFGWQATGSHGPLYSIQRAGSVPVGESIGDMIGAAAHLGFDTWIDTRAMHAVGAYVAFVPHGKVPDLVELGAPPAAITLEQASGSDPTLVRLLSALPDSHAA